MSYSATTEGQVVPTPNIFTYTLDLIPLWQTQAPNAILVITYFTVSSRKYSASITGPGLKKAVSFPNNKSGCSVNTLPKSTFKFGSVLPYTVTIKTNSTKLSSDIATSQQIGTKIVSGNNVGISFQTSLFINDDGNDLDYNDCVINLALYNSSND